MSEHPQQNAFNFTFIFMSALWPVIIDIFNRYLLSVYYEQHIWRKGDIKINQEEKKEFK